jgi:hypothetical protein
LRFCDFSEIAISVVQGTLAISGILAILQFQPESNSSFTRDSYDIRDSCNVAISTGKRFRFHQGSLRFQGFLQFCNFNRKAILVSPETLAISGIPAILQFQRESDFSSTRDPYDFRDSCKFAISIEKRFGSIGDPSNFRDSCDFAISARKRFRFHRRSLRFQGLLKFCDFSEKAISVAQGTLAIPEILAILRFQPESNFSSTRDPCDFKDSCNVAISTGKRFRFHQGSLRFQGFLRFCNFNQKAILIPPGTLAISGIPVILRFQQESDFSSTKDPCDFRDSCDFAISTGKQFQFH